MPRALGLLQRFLGVFVTLSLIFSPWFIAFDVEDPFLHQAWLTFGLGILASCVVVVQHLLYRPRRRQLPLLWPSLACFASLILSTLPSSFLVSLRSGLLLATQLLLLMFLRLVRQSRDTGALVALLVVNGTCMAGYAIAQHLGYDPITWVDSPYRAVGTLSNPNFLGAYLMVTCLLAGGALFHPAWARWPWRVLLGAALAVHLVAMSQAGAAAAWVGLGLGLFLLATRFWEVPAGRVLRRSPFLGGAILAILLTAGYWLAATAIRNYPWDRLSIAPNTDMSRAIVTRLLEWQMGFAVFQNHPIIGLGPGSMPYVLSTFRHPLGLFLGLSQFNDDPHSHGLLLLGEFGFLGLWAFCTLVVAVLGVHARFQARTTHPLPLHADPPPSPAPTTGSTLGPDGASSASPAGSPPSAMVAHPPLEADGLARSTTTEGGAWLARTLAAAGLALLLHGMFNNTLSILPLSNLLLLLTTLHQSVCLRDVSWHRRFSWKTLVGLFLPFAYTTAAWTLQTNHQEVTRALFAGRQCLARNQPIEAEAAFERVLRANPQSIHGLWGLAQALERQGRLGRVQDLLGHLDAIGPNIFSAKLHLARILFERNQVLDAHRYAILALGMNQAPSAYELLSRILVTEGRLQEAEQILREGLLLVPAWIPDERAAADRMRLQLAAITIDQGKFDEASALLASITPDLALAGETAYLSGVIAFRRGNATAALDLFETALQQNASDPKYMNAVGYLLTETGQNLDRAQSLLEEAYRGYRSRNPPLLSDILAVAHSLGRLYWRQGRLDKAQELLTIAFQQCPLEWKDVREERARDLRRFFQETGRPSTLTEEGQHAGPPNP